MGVWDTEWLFRMFEIGLGKLGFWAGDSLSKLGDNTGDKGPGGRVADTIATARMMRGDKKELFIEYQKLLKYSSDAKETLDAFCRGVVQEVLDPPMDTLLSPLTQAYFVLCSKLLTYEGYFPLPEIDFSKERSLGEIWKLTERVKRCLDFFENRENRHWFRLMSDPHERFCWTTRLGRVMLLRGTSLSRGGDYDIDPHAMSLL